MSNTTAIDHQLAVRLRDTRLVTEEQMDVVRQLQEEASVSLAEALTQLDILSESEVRGIVSSIRQVRQINIEEVDIDREAVRHVPAAVAVQFRLLPLRRSGNSLVVAMTDPQDPHALQALRNVTDHEIVPFLADPEAMEHALLLYYDSVASVGFGLTEREGSATVRSSEDSWRCELPYAQTLENFIECDANRQARNLAFQIAANSRDVYSCPVLFVGPKGCGKSHLLNAISTYISRKQPMMKGLLISGRELMDRYADYGLAGKSQLLRFELRDRDFVVLTDLGCLAGMRRVERELHELIASARQQNAWVIGALSADELICPNWLPELRKELDNGLIVHMDTPDASTRRAILAKHATDGSCDESVLSRLSGNTDLGEAIHELRDAFFKFADSKGATD